MYIYALILFPTGVLGCPVQYVMILFPTGVRGYAVLYIYVLIPTGVRSCPVLGPARPDQSTAGDRPASGACQTTTDRPGVPGTEGGAGAPGQDQQQV